MYDASKIISALRTSFFLLVYFSLVVSISCFADNKKTLKTGDFKGAKTATHPSWFKESFLDLEEDINDAKEQGKRLVVYFWQPGCPYCSQLWEDNFSQQDIEENFRKQFEIVAINLWGDREVVSIKGKDYTEKSFSEALTIQYTPTLLFFDETQKVILQLNGYVPPENFKLALQYAKKKDDIKDDFEGSFAEFVASKQKPEDSKQSSGSLHYENFFSEPSHNLDRSKQESDKYLAIFFEKKNCKNCDLLHEKTLRVSETRRLAQQFESVQLKRYASTPVVTPDGKTTTAKDWANSLNISYLPAIVFFDPLGKEVMRIDTQMRSFHIQSVFDYVLSGSYKTQKNFQRYISARADKLRENGIDVDIWAY